MGRMLEIYHENAGRGEAEVFYSMDEALKWLGREEEKRQNEVGRPTPKRYRSANRNKEVAFVDFIPQRGFRGALRGAAIAVLWA